MLLPVKAFARAKQRLSGVLDADQRAQLARDLATGVVAASHLPVFVVCDDEDVRSWASSTDAEPIWTPGLGLNGAIDAAVRALAERGVDRVVIAHADLPRPRHLDDVAAGSGITLVPDRRRDGTNVLAFPTRTPLRARYGAGSFDRHLDAARRMATEHALTVTVRSDPDLALDIDTPSDLVHPRNAKVLPTWLPTPLVNHSHPTGSPIRR